MLFFIIFLIQSQTYLKFVAFKQNDMLYFYTFIPELFIQKVELLSINYILKIMPSKLNIFKQKKQMLSIDDRLCLFTDLFAVLFNYYNNNRVDSMKNMHKEDNSEEIPLTTVPEELEQGQIILPPKKQQPPATNKKHHEMLLNALQIFTVIAIFITVFIILGVTRALLHNIYMFRHGPQQLTNNHTNSSSPSFPKILWIYTENEIETEGVMEEVMINYYAFLAGKFGYEVRFANSWNSYDWLSQMTTQLITRAMHNTKIDQGVNSFLKLALLMEHGGLLFSSFDFFITTYTFDWIEELFVQTEQPFANRYLCNPKDATLFLQRSKTKTSFDLHYNEGFAAAMPNSKLLRQAFDICLDIFIFGTVPENDKLKLIDKKWSNNALGVNNAFELSVNLALHRRTKNLKNKNKNCLQMQEMTKKYQTHLQQLSSKHPLNVLTEPYRREALLQKGLFLISASKQFKIVLDHLYSIINGKKDAVSLHQSSILSEVLNAPGNKQIFIEPLTEREIQLCLIIMDQLNQKQIQLASKAYTNQSYDNWKLILPTKDPSTIQGITDKRVIIMQAKSNKVHNIEHAAIKQCNNKGYAVLLNYGENFSDRKALSMIAQAVRPRQVVGAFISLRRMSDHIDPIYQVLNFNRGRDGIVNPKINLIQSIVNHMRIFSIQSFRYIPQFDLRDIFGKYFSDRIIFLMTLLEMTNSPISDSRMLYIAKKYAHIWNIPWTRAIINSSIAITTSRLEQIDKEQLARTKARIQCESIQQTMKALFENKIPFSKILSLNPGNDFVSVDNRTGPNFIPKIIHQAWLGTNYLPPAKEYFFKKTKKMYPNYEVKLWRQQNITRNTFPLTYDILQTLIQFNKNNTQNKLTSITDIMRHQVLYHQGGFWKDVDVNLLRPIFDKFLKFKIALPADKTFRFRWFQTMCFLANAPKSANMWRITNYRNLNRMKLYSTNPMTIAGPIDFRQFVSPDQEYDPDILLMPYDTFYPGQINQHPQNDICTKRYEQLRKGQKFLFVESRWYLLAHCASLYPYAYAIEHNRFSKTGQKKLGLKSSKNS